MMNQENVFEYNSPHYKDFLKEFRNLDDSDHRLIVLAGTFTTNRKAALDELKREIIGEIVDIDLAEVITPYEDQSYQKIDECFASISGNTSLVIFRNAEQLNGAYTGFTSSVVRYATPQEKYFLKKTKEIKAPVVLEFKNQDELDRTVTRTADAVVLFKPPSSLLEKLAWKAKNVQAHGSRFLSVRPQ